MNLLIKCGRCSTIKHNRIIYILAAVSILQLLTPGLGISSGVETEQTSRLSPGSLFYQMDRHFTGSFAQYCGAAHILAATGTYILVDIGVDWKWHSLMRDNSEIAYGGFPAVILGGLTPLLVPAGLYYYGKSKDNLDLQITGLALGQAAILGLFTSSIYKTFTGRRPPDILDKTHEDADFSRDFKFGFLQRGIFDGWPSGHTTVAFAMAVTLNELYPDNRNLHALSLLYATFVGAGVSTNIHWLSDAVAGALIGYSIGKSVGRGFRGYRDDMGRDSTLNLSLVPAGISIVYLF